MADSDKQYYDPSQGRKIEGAYYCEVCNGIINKPGRHAGHGKNDNPEPAASGAETNDSTERARSK